MKLSKMISNSLDAGFKRLFNDNVDKLNKKMKESDNQSAVLKERIDNLVIKSCESSDNEVVDARVDSNGVAHDVLSSRLNNDYKETKEDVADIKERFAVQDEKVTDLDRKVNEVISKDSESLDIHVSQERGDDENNDGSEEKPFATISKAESVVPIINSGNVNILIDKGVYKEDVLVNGKTFKKFELINKNYNQINITNDEDTGVFLRSLNISDCNGYVSVRGFTQVDSINAPLIGNLGEEQAFISITRCNYAVVSDCIASENTKKYPLNYSCIYYNGTIGRLYRNRLDNQMVATRFNYISQCDINNENKGINNATGVMVGRSIVYANGKFGADREFYNYDCGQIFKKATYSTFD